MVLAFQGPFST